MVIVSDFVDSLVVGYVTRTILRDRTGSWSISDHYLLTPAPLSVHGVDYGSLCIVFRISRTYLRRFFDRNRVTRDKLPKKTQGLKLIFKTL